VYVGGSLDNTTDASPRNTIIDINDEQ